MHLAQTKGYEFFIDWRHSYYLDKSYKGDLWSYYFQPCFANAQRPAELSLLPVGKAIACAKDNIITPRNVGNQIDYVRFFDPVDKVLAKDPRSKIFACSDSQVVIDHIKMVIK